MKIKLFNSNPYPFFLISILVFILLSQNVPGIDQVNPDNPSKQIIYRNGVPHLTKTGRQIQTYDPENSFFPIGLWGIPESRIYQGMDYRWNQLVDAGINTVWPWPMGGYTTDEQLSQAEQYGLKVILMRRPGEEQITNYLKKYSSLFGIVWQDEPILQTNYSLKWLDEFTEYKKMVNRIAPDLPVFVNNCAWFDHPDWNQWIISGNISCHDNYPIWPVTQSINLGSFGNSSNGIANTISKAVQLNHESKPVWLILGAFESFDSATTRFPFRFPSPEQLRAMAYTGIIHGATGICYFIWDSHICRPGNIGISSNPKPRVSEDKKTITANPIQLIKSKTLWQTMIQINKEIDYFKPALLSPTVTDEIDYSIKIDGDSITTNPIRTILKPNPEGGYFLFTVNMDNSVLVATFEFNQQIHLIQTLFDNRNPQHDIDRPDKFNMVYEPFDTHIFKINLMD